MSASQYLRELAEVHERVCREVGANRDEFDSAWEALASVYNGLSSDLVIALIARTVDNFEAQGMNPSAVVALLAYRDQNMVLEPVARPEPS